MILVDALQRIINQDVANEELLRLITKEINEYLPSDEHFDLMNLPDPAIIFNVITNLSEEMRSELYQKNLDDTAKNNNVVSELDEISPKTVLAILGVILVILSTTLSIERFKAIPINDILSILLK